MISARMTLKIIHVMLDEKFNDMAIRQFEAAAPGIHEYWVTSKELVFTTSILAKRCAWRDLIVRFKKSDVTGVIFHSLPAGRYSLLKRIPAGKSVVWLGFGYDYYSLLQHDDENTMVLSKTRKMASKSHWARIQNLPRKIASRLLFPERHNIDLLQRVDFFSPVLDSEFDLLNKHIRLRAKYIEWNYGTVEEDLSRPGVFADGKNILAGNSASATNNHIELFEAIRDQVDLTGRKVIVPLSYGDIEYREKIIAAGKKILPGAFEPLTEFVPKDDYLSTIQSCGFVMMNHSRQQALGNICMAMLLGARVYLQHNNPLSSWFARRGAIFGDMGNLDMRPLSDDEKRINHDVIQAHWGKEVQITRTLKLVQSIICGDVSA